MNNKKKAAKMLCIFSAILSAGVPSYAKDIKVNYSHEEEAVFGEMRYVAQISESEFYYEDYWGEYAPYSSNECGTACISMALSYLGIDKTPKELGDYWIQRGYTEGEPFSTVFTDVPGATGGHSYDFFKAFDRYENEEGVSPVIIYFTKEINPYQTGNRHFVLVTDCLGDGKYSAVDPASPDRLTVKIEKNEEDSFLVSLTAKNGEELSGTVTEYQLCSAQYYIDADSKKKTALPEDNTVKTEDTKISEKETEHNLKEEVNAAFYSDSAENEKGTSDIKSADDEKGTSDREEKAINTASKSFEAGLKDKTPYSTAAKIITEAIRIAAAE